MQSVTLKELAQLLNAQVVGDENAAVTHLAPLDQADQGSVSFLTDAKYKKVLVNTKATAVMLTKEFADSCPTNVLVMDNPYFGFAKMAAFFDQTPAAEVGIHPSAVISEQATIGADVSIGPNVVIAADVTIGDGSIIMANCVIEGGSVVGAGCKLHPNVTVYHHSILGQRVEIHSGAVIGSDGFGNARDDKGQWVKIPQLGRVVIEDDVEIGANTTIDRGALGDTILHAKVKLDNQIQIAHNVEIGEGTAIAACSGVAGSTKIGKNCLFGGAVGISGHLEITDQVALTAQSGVSKSLTKPGVYSASMPVLPIKQWLKTCAYFRKLGQLNERISKLEQENK